MKDSLKLALNFCQIAWVVKDIAAAEKFFIETMGIEKFLRMENLSAKDTASSRRSVRNRLENVSTFGAIMKMIKLAVALGLLAVGVAAQAATFNLASDWSDSSNPNGTWAYGVLTGTSFSTFTTHVPNYINVGPPAFTAPQPAWTSCIDTGNNGCPQGLAKSTGVAAAGKDFPIGRVGGHTPLTGWLAVQWTAPSAGSVSISGDAWTWQDIGRTLVTTVLFDGVQLFSPVAIPTQASGTTSASPFTFSQAAISAAGSPSALQNINVRAGDTITWIAAEATGSTEWFVGVDMTAVLTPVPEARTLSMFVSGLALIAFLSLLRKATSRSESRVG